MTLMRLHASHNKATNGLLLKHLDVGARCACANFEALVRLLGRRHAVARICAHVRDVHGALMDLLGGGGEVRLTRRRLNLTALLRRLHQYAARRRRLRIVGMLFFHHDPRQLILFLHPVPSSGRYS